MGMIVDLAVIDYCRQIGIQTGRQADMDRYLRRQADRKTNRQADKLTGRQTDRQTN